MANKEHTVAVPSLNVAVSGPRKEDLHKLEVVNSQAIIDALTRTFTSLQESLHNQQPGDSTLRVIAGCAEGTDSDVLLLCRTLDIAVNVLTPHMPESLDVGNFDSVDRIVSLGVAARETSATICDDEQDRLNQAAQQVRDDIALTFSDLLVVIWNGEMTGSFGVEAVGLIYRAMKRRKPVVWIDAAGVCHIADLHKLDQSSLHALDAYAVDAQLIKDLFVDEDEEASSKLDFFVKMSLFPWLLEPDLLGAADQSESYLARLKGISESRPEHKMWVGRIDSFFMSLPRFSWEETRKSLRSDITGSDLGSVDPGLFPEERYPVERPGRLLNPFKAADVKANQCAGRHRDGIWLLYLLAASAVFAAVLGSLHAFPYRYIHHFWAYTELLILLLVGLIVWRARKSEWHADWLGWRFVAEQLRYGAMGFPILAAGSQLNAIVWDIRYEHREVQAGSSADKCDEPGSQGRLKKSCI